MPSDLTPKELAKAYCRVLRAMFEARGIPLYSVTWADIKAMEEEPIGAL